MPFVLKLFLFASLAIGLFLAEQLFLSYCRAGNPLHVHLAYAGVTLFLALVIFWPGAREKC